MLENSLFYQISKTVNRSNHIRSYRLSINLLERFFSWVIKYEWTLKTEVKRDATTHFCSLFIIIYLEEPIQRRKRWFSFIFSSKWVRIRYHRVYYYFFGLLIFFISLYLMLFVLFLLLFSSWSPLFVSFSICCSLSIIFSYLCLSFLSIPSSPTLFSSLSSPCNNTQWMKLFLPLPSKLTFRASLWFGEDSALTLTFPTRLYATQNIKFDTRVYFTWIKLNIDKKSKLL